MADSGVAPGVVSYTSLLNAYGQAGDLAAAHQLLREMQAGGVHPNHFTYTSLMGYYSQRGDVAKVQASFYKPFDIKHGVHKPSLVHNRMLSFNMCMMCIWSYLQGLAGMCSRGVAQSYVPMLSCPFDIRSKPAIQITAL